MSLNSVSELERLYNKLSDHFTQANLKIPADEFKYVLDISPAGEQGVEQLRNFLSQHNLTDEVRFTTSRSASGAASMFAAFRDRDFADQMLENFHGANQKVGLMEAESYLKFDISPTKASSSSLHRSLNPRSSLYPCLKAPSP